MKILFAVHHYPPRYQAGAEKYTRNAAQWMAERGHAVRVICVEDITLGRPNGLVTVEEWDGQVQVTRIFLSFKDFHNQRQNEFDHPGIGQVARQIIQNWHPDVLHLVSGYLMTTSVIRAARESGVASLVTLTDYWFLCPRLTLQKRDGNISEIPAKPATCAQCLGDDRQRYRLLARLSPGAARWYWSKRSDQIGWVEDRQRRMSAAMAEASLLVSPSQFLRTMYLREGVSQEKILFVRHGVKTPELVIERDPLPGENDIIRVGYIGQISTHKGVHLAVEAIRMLGTEERLQLEIFGSLEHFPDYVNQIRKLAQGDKRIRLSGPFSGPVEQARAYQSIDVLVVPSTWYENCPMSILEAYSHGIPVIASDQGGTAELVRDGKDGLLFEMGSSQDLANQLRRLVNEPGLLHKLRAGILPSKTHFDEMIQIEGLYQRILKETRWAQQYSHHEQT